MTALLFHVDSPAVADSGDELSIQVRLRKALKMRAPTVNFAAVPNGAQRTAWAAMKAKQEGLQPGFADCILQWPGAGIAFTEIKARSGQLSEQQHIWLNWQVKAGFNAGVFRAVNTCLWWLFDLGAPIDMTGLERPEGWRTAA